MDCRDLEKVLKRDDPADRDELAVHLHQCGACSAEVERWNELSLAARSLHREWNSAGLWSRIGSAIESESKTERPLFLRVTDWFQLRWQPAVAALILAALTSSLVWVVLRDMRAPESASSKPAEDVRLLSEQALREIEGAEEEYVRSIEKLSALVEPRIQSAASPLLVSYREKLAIIDAAIADLRENIEENSFNAHLRHELLSVYREKHSTLEELMRGETHETR